MASKRKPTSLYFCIQDQISFGEFVKYLNHIISEENLTLCKWKPSGAVIEAEVRFDSLSKAKAVLKSLRKKGKGFEVSMMDFTNPNFDSQLDRFKESLQEKKSTLEMSHCKKLTELQKELRVLDERIRKRCTPAQFESISQERQSVQERVKECSDQLMEFVHYCDQLIPKIERLRQSGAQSKGGQACLQNMRKEFGLECSRFTKALPIYARRESILSTVKENQVSILIGETGSGKSTQLVQYLYYAGFAAKGKIACTQPRKVAAVTLAGHVSGEMGVRLGVEVGYKVGEQGGKSSSGTRVFFMTDHALLNDCITDRDFSEYSCIIIDEAHERSLQTDILLAFIKQCLPRRPDLRVIITSATIDPKQFTCYFGATCPLVYVSGRAFPVELIWNPLRNDESPITQDYKTNAVQMAKKLHQEEKEGDILVFLTGAAEIDRACEKLSQELGNTACILPLHGKLQPDDQQKVFEPSLIRKIVFATNVAETSVTIPGVKYIVDTGLAKEMHFDPRRNMNSLEVCLISKSSAEQRKGRAGRTSAGKCYRLYSHDVHNKMPERTAPEIMRVHLTHAALKLFQLGVGNILDFDFVEHPDREALTKAVGTLEFIGCIKDNELTHLGKQMALFPIDPQLTKVLFLGIEYEIAYEAMAVVAMSSSGGSVFFRSEEVKDESDRKKLEFCHHLGDQLTHLSVYMKWVQQKKENRNMWCVENFINAKTMRLVEESIKDFRLIFQNSLSISVPTKMATSCCKAEEILPQVLFDVYLRNTCIFLGHERVGYMSDKLPGENLCIFPGSVLRKLNATPEYVVYEKTLKTSQNFLLGVVPVKREWVEKAVENGKMQDPLKCLQPYLVTPVYFTNIGEQVYHRAIFSKGQLKVKEEIQLACSNRPWSFDCKPEKGLLVIHTSRDKHAVTSEVVDKRVNAVRDEMQKCQFEYGVTSKDDDVRVVLGIGGCIQHVLMPYEYRTLVVKGEYDEKWLGEFVDHLVVYGEIEKHTRRSSYISLVTFRSPEQAYMANTTLDRQMLPEGVSVQPQLRKVSGFIGTQFTLEVEWSRRSRQTCAFMTFNKEEDHTIAASQLANPPNNTMMIAGSKVKFKPGKDTGKNRARGYQLFLSNVGHNVTEADLKLAINTHLQMNLQYSVSLGYEKSFSNTKEQMTDLKHQLEGLVAKRINQDLFTVDLKTPEPQHITFRAFVKFVNRSDSITALDFLCSQNMRGHPLHVKPVLSTCITYPQTVYSSISDTVDKAIKEDLVKLEGVQIEVSRSPKFPNVRIRIKSHDVENFITAKKIMNSTLQPDVVQCLTPELKRFVLRRQSQVDFARISSSTSTYISFNRRLMVINVYGTEANRERAKIELNKIISRLVGTGMACEDISLKSYPPGVMKFIVTEFGHDLSKLALKVGEQEIQDASLDVQRHILSLVCTSRACEVIKQSLEQYCSVDTVQKDACVSLENRIPQCCTCFCDIEDNTQVYRLEYCGHEYCLDCIQLQIAPMSVQFPLVCAADGCDKPFVWQDFENLFKKTKYRLEELLKASVSSHVAANSKKVKNCPTPDCDMIYSVTMDEKPFTCSLCSVRICTSCHVQYHDGITCEMYQTGKVPVNGDVLQWMKEDPSNRKQCPSCGSLIEKNAGCQRIECRTCKKHICWNCMEFFDSSGLCYGHLQDKHGGYF
jgi:ATP-dependent RNA helicase DHX8/PRP22